MEKCVVGAGVFCEWPVFFGYFTSPRGTLSENESFLPSGDKNKQKLLESGVPGTVVGLRLGRENVRTRKWTSLSLLVHLALQVWFMLINWLYGGRIFEMAALPRWSI